MSAIRGMIASHERDALFVVFGSRLQRVARDGTRTTLGTLRSRTGFVDMKIGVQQLVVVDGANGYVFDLTNQVFNRITSPGWLGSRRVGYVDGYFTFADPSTGVWYISQIEDASSLDALDFATASSSPDNIVAAIDDHGEAWLLGSKTVEVWRNTGAADFPFERSPGATMQTGLMGAFTAQALDNTLYWLGCDKNGGGIVWKSQGFQPVRVSTRAVEESIQRAIKDGQDMSKAVAFAYQQDGLTFYVLNVPGLPTSWAFEVSSGQWHERAEFVNGGYRPHRAQHHAYCYGKHLVGAASGVIYELDVDVNNNAGDILVRDRVSPHYATAGLELQTFGTFQLDCTVGKGKPDGSEASVMLRTSDDGGESWDDWRTESLGAIGQNQTQALFTRNGSAFDRVWHVRVTDDVPFSIVGAAVRKGV